MSHKAADKGIVELFTEIYILLLINLRALIYHYEINTGEDLKQSYPLILEDRRLPQMTLERYKQ